MIPRRVRPALGASSRSDSHAGRGGAFAPSRRCARTSCTLREGAPAPYELIVWVARARAAPGRDVPAVDPPPRRRLVCMQLGADESRRLRHLQVRRSGAACEAIVEATTHYDTPRSWAKAFGGSRRADGRSLRARRRRERSNPRLVARPVERSLPSASSLAGLPVAARSLRKLGADSRVSTAGGPTVPTACVIRAGIDDVMRLA